MRLDDYDLLRSKDVKTSLQETSKDTSDGNIRYMTLCNKRVINFDLVKRKYLNSLGLSEEKAKSVDALCQVDSNDGVLYMIEFKNGKVESRDIELKTRDSLLIFQSIIKEQLEFIRENVHFILVYNKDNNPLDIRTEKAMHMAKMGRTDYTAFGLANLREYCFKSVKALNAEEFEEEFISKLLPEKE